MKAIDREESPLIIGPYNVSYYRFEFIEYIRQDLLGSYAEYSRYYRTLQFMPDWNVT